MLEKEKINIAVIGLGYVGLPLAVEFSKKYNVIGFDLDEIRVNELNNQYDRTNELSAENLSNLKNFSITSDERALGDSNIYIVTVPTPIDQNNKPNLNPLISASEIIGRYLGTNDIVIYESTVFPSCTEEICVPILEKESKLKYNAEFFCGYSPERINPGDNKYTLTKITKVVSGSNDKTLNIISKLYESIIPAGIFKASSIRVAEAAKVIENTQRDVNIALINELAIIFNKLNLDTREVLEAASTKWNFLPFEPGLVGGHCIGVDPYYLTHKAIEVGYNPEIILAGRRINDNMGSFISSNTISLLASQGISSLNAKIAILGLTFKENCPDLRNTKVIDIVEHFQKYKCEIIVCDSWANEDDSKQNYGISLTKLDNVTDMDAVIIAVGHNEYRNFNKDNFLRMMKPNAVFIDIKSLYNSKIFMDTNIKHWRL